MRIFTWDELHQYDGKEGRPAYVAFQGKVYDVSASFLWRSGKHQALHQAGKDLTEAFKDAPPWRRLVVQISRGGGNQGMIQIVSSLKTWQIGR